MLAGFGQNHYLQNHKRNVFLPNSHRDMPDSVLRCIECQSGEIVMNTTSEKEMKIVVVKLKKYFRNNDSM